MYKWSRHLLQTVDDRVYNPGDAEIDDSRVPGYLPVRRSTQNYDWETNLTPTNEQGKIHGGQMLEIKRIQIVYFKWS